MVVHLALLPPGLALVANLASPSPRTTLLNVSLLRNLHLAAKSVQTAHSLPVALALLVIRAAPNATDPRPTIAPSAQVGALPSMEVVSRQMETVSVKVLV